MATMADFRSAAKRVSNWGRWGEDDETRNAELHHARRRSLRRASSCARARCSRSGSSSARADPRVTLLYRTEPGASDDDRRRRRRDVHRCRVGWDENPVAKQIAETFAASPLRFNDDMIIMPLQAAHQWDALSHVYYEDQLYNGFSST